MSSGVPGDRSATAARMASAFRCSMASVMSGRDRASVPASEQQWGTASASQPTRRRVSTPLPRSESWQGEW